MPHHFGLCGMKDGLRVSVSITGARKEDTNPPTFLCPSPPYFYLVSEHTVLLQKEVLYQMLCTR